MENEIQVYEPQQHTGAIMNMTRAEIDSQIATAKKFPRSIKQFREAALEMATADREIAAECFYVLQQGGERIEGPSVRLAEIAVSAWGNARAMARIIEEADDYIVAQGMAIDLERNTAASVEVRRSIVKKDGTRFSPNMIQKVCSAACSIAYRNAVFKVIPAAYIKPVYQAAKKVSVGESKSITDRIQSMFAHFARSGVSEDRVLAAVGVASREGIGEEELATLHGMATAIKDGDTTADAAFPKVTEGEGATEGPKSDRVADRIGTRNGRSE